MKAPFSSVNMFSSVFKQGAYAPLVVYTVFLQGRNYEINVGGFNTGLKTLEDVSGWAPGREGEEKFVKYRQRNVILLHFKHIFGL